MTAADRLSRRVDEQDLSIRALSDTLIDIKVTVDQHTGQLGGIQRTLARHSAELRELRESQAAMQESQAAMQETLAGHGGQLASVHETLAGHGGQLASVQEALAEILRRLDPR